MKKKLIAICLIIAMMAITVVGGTMAYFFDTAEATNTFTVGNVTIDLEEKQATENGLKDYPEEEQPLMPGTKDKNNVSKIAWISNTSKTNAAWVWAEVLIPAKLDNSTDPSQNSLHFNIYGQFEKNYFNADWNSSYSGTPALDGILDEETHQPKVEGMVEAKMENTWTNAGWVRTEELDREVDGTTMKITYNVYRFKMETQLPAESISLPFLRQVYMDMEVIQCLGSRADCGDDTCQGYILKDGSHYGADMPWDLVVRGYAMQNEGFETVDEAITAYEEAQK